jgi:hypothetical protein
MKAFIIYGNDYEEGVVIFAKSYVAARRLGAQSLGIEFSEVDSCKRSKEYDEYIPLGYVPVFDLVERFGWFFQCAHCGHHVYNHTEGRSWSTDHKDVYCSSECRIGDKRLESIQS